MREPLTRARGRPAGSGELEMALLASQSSCWSPGFSRLMPGLQLQATPGIAGPNGSILMSNATTGQPGGLIPLSDEKAALEILTKSVMGLWETVNNLTRLRPTRRDRYRVTIFGSARVEPGHWVYKAVRDL